MGRPRKTVENQKQTIGFIELCERFEKGETITDLAEELKMNPVLLNTWIKEFLAIDDIIKTEREHQNEKKNWQNMYLKVAYRLEQLENKKLDS